ncbi:ATP synthase F1 subunit delta [bacterium]|nr:ATP synthase F1 subunit delta [bacterium]
MSQAAARRYAKALLEIASGKGAVESYATALTALAEAMAPELARLASPLLAREQRASVVDAIATAAGAPADVANLLRVLADKGRIGELPSVAQAYAELAALAAGELTARVTSAAPLDDATVGRLRAKLTRKFGKSVTIRPIVDPSVIGGMKTQVGSLVIDGTLAGQLSRFAGTVRKD